VVEAGKDGGVTTTPARTLRCALFVDFDNVYLGLKRLDADAAAAFAESPGLWLAAFEDGADASGEFSRRYLVRNCYLNPSAFSQFRANFTRAGFSVVDCPSLTQQGKSSADINLVLDAVDALAAQTHYDEFVIVSADADFTPLALRCRAADRRVTIVTASPAASAYRAVADEVVAADALAALLRTAVAAADEGTTEGGARRANGAGSGRAGGGAGKEATGPTASNGGAAAPTENAAAGAPSSSPARQPATTKEAKADATKAAAKVDLAPLQRQITTVTDVPNLRTEFFAVLLQALADDAAKQSFDRELTSRRVYEACQAAEANVGRSSVKQVIDGVLYAGLDLRKKPALKKLAETWADHVVGLCRGARIDLTKQDLAAVRQWVTGGIVTR